MSRELDYVATKEPGTVSKLNDRNRKEFSVLSLRGSQDGPKMQTGRGFQKSLDLPY